MTVQPNAPTPAMVAVDWGGTWCRVSLIDRQGEVLWQARRPNPRGGDADEYLALAATLLGEAFGLGEFRPLGIGIAVAGPVDPESGILYQPPNLMALDGVSLKRIWQERPWGKRFRPVVVRTTKAVAKRHGLFHNSGS